MSEVSLDSVILTNSNHNSFIVKLTVTEGLIILSVVCCVFAL